MKININLKDYRIIELKDYSTEDFCERFLVHKKHTFEEFQKEWNKARKRAEKDIEKYGDDYNYIMQNMNKNIDFFELGEILEDYGEIVYF